MRLSLRLASCLIVVISLITFIVARYQAGEQEQDLRADLERRAQDLGDSLQQIIQPILESGSVNQLQPIVERFGSREKVEGVVVYDTLGQNLAASSPEVTTYSFVPPVNTSDPAGAQRTPLGQFVHLLGKTIYVYLVPLHRNAETGGYVSILQDATYIDAQKVHFWRHTLWHVAAQLLSVVLITFVIIRWRVVSPISKTTQWMKELRSGKISPRPKLPNEDFFQPLSQEVSNLAQSLAQARGSAEEEARLRECGDSLWTAERLRVSVKNKLGDSRIVVVSNREPYEHVRNGKTVGVVVPASGLVTALEPILRACRGTWIAYGSGDADRETVDPWDRVQVPPDSPQYTLRRVWLQQEEIDGYYHGFANEGMWPLCHIAHTRPIFEAKNWAYYQQVNEKFAEVVLQEIHGAESPLVLVQDYHFALLPKLVKQKRPDVRVAIFWHIPWPNPEAFGICPWQRQVLDGLLGADLVSFHTQSHCNNFLATVDRVLEAQVDWERFAVNRASHLTAVRPYPISVAFSGPNHDTGEERPPLPDKVSLLQSLGVEGAYLGVGVDRVDYTKGIIERFRGIEHFLEKNPLYQGLFTFVQIGAPSRTNIKRYHDLLAEVDAEATRINKRFETKKWKPIVLFRKHHSQKQIEPFYKAADFCLVTSLHDGMNLVAKEFVASREDEKGVLILSRFTGACGELRDALIVNPYDIEQLSECIRYALEMTPEDQRSRMRSMRRIVKERNVYKWAADLISALVELRVDGVDSHHHQRTAKPPLARV